MDSKRFCEMLREGYVHSSAIFREKQPDGESASPYVFVCRNHQELLVKYPMSGQHKIYKLDPQIHQAAKKSVKRRSGAA